MQTIYFQWNLIIGLQIQDDMCFFSIAANEVKKSYRMPKMNMNFISCFKKNNQNQNQNSVVSVSK